MFQNERKEKSFIGYGNVYIFHFHARILVFYFSSCILLSNEGLKKTAKENCFKRILNTPRQGQRYDAKN